MTPKQIKLAKVMLDDPTVTHQEVADASGVSRATLYRTLNKERDPQRLKELEAVKRDRHAKKVAAD